MSFTWTEDLATGVTDIDAQHKELISKVNALIAACNEGRDRGEIGKYLDFLCEYIAYHFAAEEREMTGRSYPGLAAHETQHEQFKRQVNDLFRQFSLHGASVQVVLMTIHASGTWLVNHIQQTDREMAAFLKKS
jgi:hemerythrin